MTLILTTSLQTNRVEVFDSGIAETARDFWRCNDSRNGMAIAHGFAQRDYVRYNVLAVQLKGPHVSADPSETDLNLIRNTDSSRFAHVSIRSIHSIIFVFSIIFIIYVFILALYPPVTCICMYMIK